MKLLGILVAALLISGCGSRSPEPDEDQWKSELSKIGVEPADWDAYQALWVEDMCEADSQALALATTLRGAPSRDEFEVSIDNACPERNDDLESAFSEVDDASNNVDEACSTPANQRTEDQADLAEAMEC